MPASGSSCPGATHRGLAGHLLLGPHFLWKAAALNQAGAASLLTSHLLLLFSILAELACDSAGCASFECLELTLQP